MEKVMEIGGAKMVPPITIILKSQNATSKTATIGWINHEVTNCDIKLRSRKMRYQNENLNFIKWKLYHSQKS